MVSSYLSVSADEGLYMTKIACLLSLCSILLLKMFPDLIYVSHVVMSLFNIDIDTDINIGYIG